MGAMMAALSEGVALAERSCVDASTLLDVLDQGVMSNPLFRLKGPALLRGEFPPAFPLKHMQKDLGLALTLAETLGQKLPVAEAVNLRFLEALGKNLGDADFSAVHEVVGK